MWKYWGNGAYGIMDESPLGDFGIFGVVDPPQHLVGMVDYEDSSATRGGHRLHNPGPWATRKYLGRSYKVISWGISFTCWKLFWRSGNCCDGRLQLLFPFKPRLAWFSNHVTAPITFRLCNKSNSCIPNGISNKNDYFAISGLNRCKELSCVFSLIAFLNIERIATAQLSSFLAWKTLSLSDAWI